MAPMPRLVSVPEDTFSPRAGQMIHAGSTQEKGSVKLSCLSPDGRFVHSLVTLSGSPCIETRSLPLPESSENQNEESFMHVRTRLTQPVGDALRRYPPLELLCVDVDAGTSTSSDGRSIPQLCIYTQRDVFLLDLTYEQHNNSNGCIDGTVSSVSEPFDDIILGTHSSAKILRIRPAPQRSHGFATMCPRGSMAMLMFDPEMNDYSFHLYHGRSHGVGTPLTFGIEQLDDEYERVTDFCFGKSSGLSLFSSLTVLFLKASSDVLMATPILFRGSVVSKQAVTSAEDFFDHQMDHCEKATSKWRQYRAAKQFFADAFSNDGRSSFVTAHVRSDAFDWPVSIQGPILIAAESDDYTAKACAIESLPAPSELIGVGIAHDGETVDFGLLSPSICIPRFKFESSDDTACLDENLKWGSIVQRVDWGDDEDNRRVIHNSILLLPDPVLDNHVHYVTKKTVRTISTNIFQVIHEQMKMQSGSITAVQRQHEKKTTAWSTVDVTSGGEASAKFAVDGIVISGDPRLGHTMVCQLSHGNLVPINLTESRHYNEIESIGSSAQQLAMITEGGADPTLSQSEALHSLVKPLAEQIVSGLKGMTRVVGSSTAQSDITPDLLAVSLGIKKRCDDSIVLPLLELRQIVEGRKKELVVLHRNQLEQVKLLKKSVDAMMSRAAKMRQQKEALQQAALSLHQRSSSTLQSARDLQPTITQAEHDYFQELKRLDTKCVGWKADVSNMEKKAENLKESLDGYPSSKLALTLNGDQVGSIKQLLDATGIILKKNKKRMTTSENIIREYAGIAGTDMDMDSDGPTSFGQ